MQRISGVNIWLMTVAITCTSIIATRIALTNATSTEPQVDIISAKNGKLTRGSENEDKKEINCPERCVCFKKSDESTVIARCRNLNYTTASQSKIGRFTSQNNSKLRSLNVNGYYQLRHDCNTSQSYWFDAQSLTEFSISVTNYTCWSSSTFSKISNLTYLKFERLNLKLMPGLFAPLQKLVKLEIHHVAHINIVENAFDGLNLQTLILTYSVVKSLANIHIDGLKHLHLENNLMKNIGKNEFIGMPALERLEIIACDTEIIHENAFSHLVQLRYLNIGGNKIVSFTDNHVRNNYKLEVLLLAYNKNLKNLPVFKLNSTDNSNYTIHEFDCCSCGLETITDGTFNAMPALTHLSLGKNRLETLPYGFFESLSSLKSLDLSKNLISQVSGDMFEGAIKLTQLNLAHNLLATIQMSSFLQTPELSALDLSQCKIEIWNGTGAPSNSLRFLSLTGNQLKHITINQLKTVPYLSSLKVSGNPIMCDTEFNETIYWLELHHVGTSVEIATSVYCDSQFDKKSCWNIFQDVLCNPNEISKYNCTGEDNRNDHCLGDMSGQQHVVWSISQWCYDNIIVLVLNFSSAITIIACIAIIVKLWPRTQKYEKNIVSPHVDLIYKPLNAKNNFNDENSYDFN